MGELSGEWTRPQTDAEADAEDRALFDAIEYARVVVAIGRNPDNPGHTDTYMSFDPDAGHVCLLDAAELLRAAADALEERHGPEAC